MRNAIDEMNRFLTETVTAAEMTADDDGLPFETIGAFSTDPIGFGELSEKMLARVELIFDQTVLYNRHSPKYLKACAMLERGIKYLGSACLTKIALEKKKKMSFPELRQLSTEKLYRMASFNFRKLDTALTENVEGKHELTDGLLDMQFRYYNLLQRLRSTDVKIYNYYFKLYYEKEDWTPVLHGDAFSKKGVESEYTKDHMDPPAFRNAPAFPLLSEAASGQRPAVSSQDPGILMQDPEISCQESGQRDRESDQWPAAGGQQITGSDAAGSLPEADNIMGIAVSVMDNSESARSEENNSALTEVPHSESDKKRTPLSDDFPSGGIMEMITAPDYRWRNTRLAAIFSAALNRESQYPEPREKDSG